MGSDPSFRKAFVARLKQACDESKLVPLPGQGRQQFIVDRLKVSPEAVSKWFNGVSMPHPARMADLAELLEVDHSWLHYGIKPEMDRKERREFTRELEGAVLLVQGSIMLAGAHTGYPTARDARSSYIDFYVTFRGSVYPVKVTIGREVSKDHFEMLVPKEYEEVRNIAVVPAGTGKYHFLRLSTELIDEHKTRKSGGFALAVSRIDNGRYVSGSDTWQRIKNFAEGV